MWSIYARPRTLARLVPSKPKAPVRHYAGPREAPTTAMLQPEGDVAKRLSDTGVWKVGRAKARTKFVGDKTRVNVTSDKLCDDIGKYLGPSLQRHVGCDLLDLYPGAGVWSQKLHDMVKPRRHVLMEPDEALYAPFLEPLASKPNTTLTRKNGLIWDDLEEILTSLPHQKPCDPSSDEPPTRNDTLLVTANLSTYPRTRMTALYLFQLISAIRSRTLFHRYGLVRMLIWVRPEDMRPTILPNAVQFRSRGAIEAELSCEWINEVVGPDSQDKGLNERIYDSKKKGAPRERAIDVESTRRVLRRLEEQGLAIPKGRETAFMQEVRTGKGGAGELDQQEQLEMPTLAPAYAAELKALEQGYEDGEFELQSEEYLRMRALKYRKANKVKQTKEYTGLLREYGEFLHMRAEGASDEDMRAAEHEWNERISDLDYHSLSNFRLLRDNQHLFRQEPPAMMWDRRTLEPLTVEASEFFPNMPSSLLDIQPRAPNPLMSSNKEGVKVFELLIKVMMRNTLIPVSQKLNSVFPDAPEALLHACPSLRDQSKGGTGVPRHGEVSVRTMNEAQWAEIVGAWLQWHFRPGIDTLERQHVKAEEDDDDDDGGAHGSSHLLL